MLNNNLPQFLFFSVPFPNLVKHLGWSSITSLVKTLRNCISSDLEAESATHTSIALEWSQFEILPRICELQTILQAPVNLHLSPSGCLPALAVSSLQQRYTGTHPIKKSKEAEKERRGGTFYSPFLFLIKTSDLFLLYAI